MKSPRVRVVTTCDAFGIDVSERTVSTQWTFIIPHPRLQSASLTWTVRSDIDVWSSDAHPSEQVRVAAQMVTAVTESVVTLVR